MPAHTNGSRAEDTGLDPGARDFYRATMEVLERAEVPFLVGGAYAFGYYTGIVRHTKDFDLFIHPRDLDRALAAVAAAGCRAEVKFPHWLAKVYGGEYFVDLIFSSGNGVAPVDELWFEHAPAAEVLGVPVRLCPVEEMLWSKAFIMERERFDGADVAHLLHSAAERLDWDRLLARFGEHWQVLLAHLVLFGYIYPGEAGRIPSRVMEALLARLAAEVAHPESADPQCRGTILSRAQYLVDVESAGYQDARLHPAGNMSPRDVELWTRAIGEDQPEQVTRPLAAEAGAAGAGIRHAPGEGAARASDR